MGHVILKTDRLTLRRLTAEDLQELVVIQAAPDLIRFLGPFDDAAMANWLADVDENWHERGYGRVGLIERSTGRLVGRSGMMFLPEFDAAELGWTLRREAWGHGYATEAAQACLRWSFAELGLERVISLIEHGNEHSQRVAARLGMRPGAEVTHFDRPMVVHAITRAAWMQRNRESASG
jgi:RimJ/RimL family protein N-acetyltransferase